jgi:hypothetical protein
MRPIATIFGDQARPQKPKRSTERGDIFDTILSRLNPSRTKKKLPPITYGRLAYLLTDIPTKDLYVLISKCNDAERRGFPWSAIFWKEIRPAKEV